MEIDMQELAATIDKNVSLLETAAVKMAALEAENADAKAIINELRVLIENSLPVDRDAPIWEMVKEFIRKNPR